MTTGPGEFAHHFRPAGADDAPTLLLLHGTGGAEHDLLPLGSELGGDAALLSPRGQVSEHGANRWFRRHREGVFDTEDLVARTHQLADFVGGAAARYGLDPARVIAVGFSNGSNIAAAMLLLRPEVLRGAILFAPMLPFEKPARVDLSRVAVFLRAGQADPIAPPEQAEALASLLGERGAGVELHRHPGGHEIDQAGLAAASGWLTKLRAATSTDPLP